MNTKLATAMAIAATALGAASSSLAYDTSSAPTPIAVNPDGDTMTQQAFQSTMSRSQVGNGLAQIRAVPTAFVINPEGLMVVEQPAFQAERSRAAVQQDVVRSRRVTFVILAIPDGDDALR